MGNFPLLNAQMKGFKPKPADVFCYQACNLLPISPAVSLISVIAGVTSLSTKKKNSHIPLHSDPFYDPYDRTVYLLVVGVCTLRPFNI